MRFTSVLAKRYIRSQRRQSAFTVLSIALTVTILTGFFVMFSAVSGSLRAASYDKFPGHLRIMGLTEEQCRSLENESKVAEVRAEKDEDGTYSAFILFSGDIGDTNFWLEDAALKIGAEDSYKNELYAWNRELMVLDLIGDSSRLTMLRIFCLFFVYVVMLTMGLRLVIDTAFEVSSKERERQFGVLQSIGAAPRQIAGIITAESLRLSAVGIPLGLILGTGFSYGLYKAVMKSGAQELIGGTSKAAFRVDPLMLLIAAAMGLVWVLLSAYGVGMRIVRKSPMEAITTRENTVRKVRRHTLSGLLFGITGKMASRNARRQKKRFIITVLSLTVSITLFAVFSTVSDNISQMSGAIIGHFTADHDFSIYFTYQRGEKYPDEQLEDLENSGFFTNFTKITIEPVYNPDGKQKAAGLVEYMDRSMYEAEFPDAQVTYDQLAETGGYVLSGYTDDRSKMFTAASPGNTMNVTTRKQILDTEAFENGSGEFRDCITQENVPYELNIIGAVEKPKTVDQGLYHCPVIGAIETHEKIKDAQFGAAGAPTVYCDLSSDDSYQKALDWIAEREPAVVLDWDAYGQNHKLDLTLSAIKTGVLLLNILIAIVALVNMMNIVSTGIANRRSEFASLQCIGMTRGQLIAMSFIESLQFAVTAAFLSAVICGAALLCTDGVLTMIASDAMLASTAEKQQIRELLPKMDYVTPFLRIITAAAAAFAAACLTSLIMLKGQDRGSLTEQIRGAG